MQAKTITASELRAFVLGMCAGDTRLSDAMWSVLMGDEQATDAAKAAGVHKSTMSRMLAGVKNNETFQRMTLEANGKAANGS